MNLKTFRSYLKFLSRHKVYTVVSLVGFAISLTFVIILALYARMQMSMDSFHEKGDRIFLLTHDNNTGNSNPLGQYVADQLPEVEQYCRVAILPRFAGKSAEETFASNVMLADANFFGVFSFPLVEGRAQDVIVTEATAVLSETMAIRLFGNENPIGKHVFVDKESYTVSGVMKDFPYNTHFEAADVVINYGNIENFWSKGILEEWGNASFTVYFLARENADLPAKTAFLTNDFKKSYWIFKNGHSKRLDFIPLKDIYFSGVQYVNILGKSGTLNTTRIYMGISLLILIIAVLNYVNMTVAQAGFRGKEAAIRKLMGSGKGTIVKQLLSESLVMTTFAMVMAVILALLAEPYFNSILGSQLELKSQLAGGMWLVLLAGLLVLSFVSGIMPALAVASFKPLEVVKGTVARKVKTGWSKVLIVFQFMVCIALLIATFLMREQASYMAGKDVGYNKENIMVLSNVTGRIKDQQGVISRLMQVPGVESVGLGAGSPLDGGNNQSFVYDGVPLSMQVIMGDSAYFSMFGFNFTPTPAYGNLFDEKRTAFINRAAWNALGVTDDAPHFKIPGWYTFTVAGVLDDIHIRSLHSPIGPVMFQFLTDNAWPWNIFVKISSDNAYETGLQAAEAYKEMSGGRPFDSYFSDDRIYEWYENERRISAVMGTFTVLSIVIMIMGVFAMSLYMIRQKEKEIGIRKVNGATVGQVLGMLNMQSLARVGVAFVLAVPIAWYGISKWLQSFAYRIDIGVWPFVAAGVIVCVLCLASVSWQTFRAARANPVDSLKSE